MIAATTLQTLEALLADVAMRIPPEKALGRALEAVSNRLGVGCHLLSPLGERINGSGFLRDAISEPAREALAKGVPLYLDGVGLLPLQSGGGFRAVLVLDPMPKDITETCVERLLSWFVLLGQNHELALKARQAERTLTFVGELAHLGQVEGHREPLVQGLAALIRRALGADHVVVYLREDGGLPRGLATRWSGVRREDLLSRLQQHPLVGSPTDEWTRRAWEIAPLSHLHLAGRGPMGALFIAWDRHYEPTPSERALAEVLCETTMAGIQVDIYARRHAEELAQRHLERELALQRQTLIQQLIHDLRNSAYAISLIAEEIESRAEEPAEVLCGVAAIDRQVAFLNNFLKEKLRWAGGQPSGRSSCQVQTALDQVTDTLGGTLRAANQELVIDALEDASVCLSEVELTQILENLLTNAHKFSPEYATIRLTVSLAHGWVTIAVADQGPGIDPALHRKVGQLGFQVDPTAGGKGWGLANVKDILARVGGHFGFRSSPGEGSTFFVAVPTTDWGQTLS